MRGGAFAQDLLASASGEKSRAGASFSAIPYSRKARFRFLLPNRVSAAGPVTHHLALFLPTLLEGSSYKSTGIFIVVISRKHDEPRPKLAQHHEQGMIGYESSFGKIAFVENIIFENLKRDLEYLKRNKKKKIDSARGWNVCSKRRDRYVAKSRHFCV